MVSDFTFTDGDNGVACGALGTMGVVMQTTDGGQSWNNLLTAAAPFFANSSIEKVQVVTNKYFRQQ